MLSKTTKGADRMKRLTPLLLALCLLLTACGGGGTASTPEPAPEGDPFTPYYSDYTVRSMQAAVVSVTEKLGYLGVLNNLYENQAATLYEKLNTPSYRESWLDTPTDIARVQITFHPHSDPAGEVYTLFENDAVLVEHPAVGQQLYTAASGTYYQTLTYLTGVQKAQSAYFTLQGADGNGDESTAGCTLRYQSGRTVFVAAAGATLAVDLVGEGLVRVAKNDTFTLYDTVKGRKTAYTARLSDVAGQYLAAADGIGVTLYPLFSTKATARVYVVGAEAAQTVQGVSLSADGTQLHVVCCHSDGETVWDRTLAVADLLAKTRYCLGAWQTAPDATEKEQQNVGYALLKKLRHKEKALGYTLSALPEKKLSLGGDVYYLTEVGHWNTVEGTYTYTPVAHLLVDKDVTVAYEATPADNELTWDVGKNWMKR